MSDGLAQRALNAAKWTYLSTVVTAVLQVVVTAVLARLVAPAAFGLVAMASLVLRFGQYFAQMGVVQAIVQRPKLERHHVPAGFWASVVIGAAFTTIGWVTAPLAADAFHSPELSAVLRWMSLAFAITGTSTTSFALLQRGMRFRGIAITEIIAYAVGYGGALILAARGAGVWALVFAGLCQASVASFSYNVLAPSVGLPVLRWQPYRELLGFGSIVSVVSFLEFITANLDTMVIGRVSGATQLGFYNRSSSLTALPMQYLSTSLSRVLLPTFSRIQHDLPRARKAYLDVIAVFAGIGLPIAFGMSGAAREIVDVMLGAKWAPSIPVMRIVAFASATGMLSHFGGVLLESAAHLREKLVLRAGQLVVFAALLTTLGRFGLLGFASAFAASESLHLLVQSGVLKKLMGLSFAGLRQAYRPGVFGGAVTGAALYAESVAAAAWAVPSGPTLFVQILTGAALMALTVLILRDGYVYRVMRRRWTPPLGTPLARIVAHADRLARYERPANEGE